MNKREFIVALSEHYQGDRATATKALEIVLETITRQLAHGERVSIAGFGSFDVRRVDARWGSDPRTGSRVMTGSTAVQFTASSKFKSVVAGTPSLPSTTPRQKGTERRALAKAAPSKRGSPEGTASKPAPGTSEAQMSRPVLEGPSIPDILFDNLEQIAERLPQVLELVEGWQRRQEVIMAQWEQRVSDVARTQGHTAARGGDPRLTAFKREQEAKLDEATSSFLTEVVNLVTPGFELRVIDDTRTIGDVQ